MHKLRASHTFLYAQAASVAYTLFFMYKLRASPVGEIYEKADDFKISFDVYGGHVLPPPPCVF